ncbi:MAG TPA: hypothetical protein VFQ51_04920, partial [Vicinamibacteria bacterium]|nr:hypothetical protein [Vicinamibacteria bacterium]
MASLRSLGRRTLLVGAGISLVGLLGFGRAMARVSRPLDPNTILSLELAVTPDSAAAILRSWGDAGRVAARQSLLLDVPFIL